jgi:hypothetical protein
MAAPEPLQPERPVMPRAIPATFAVALTFALAIPPAGPRPALGQAPQTQTDDYTRYELQAPGSGAFRILYDVSATTAGARFYYNSIRTGAREQVHGVIDLHTGTSLPWRVVDGIEAREHGHPRASLDARYIQVALARPVPAGGQGRVRIDKTYLDSLSYFIQDGQIVFQRSLGIRRNSLVLPAGYELTEANHPVQVDTERDGRIRVSFMNPGPGSVDFRVRARPLPASAAEALRAHAATPPAPSADPADPAAPAAPAPGRGAPVEARVGWRFSERAFEDRDITYFLLQPETHAFRLFHDYTESRPGVDRYLNVVRTGSAASDPEAYNLDTGERLRVEQLKGDEIVRRGIDLASHPGPGTEVVVIWFDPVAPGASTRLRIWETYTDPGRYVLTGDDLVWDRGFGRPRNSLVLPEGWFLTANAIPGVVDLTEDGRVRVRYENPRPDDIQVFVKARRR